MTDQELIYRITLGLIPGIGPILGKKLVSYCGSVEAVFHEKKRNLERIPGFGIAAADAIVNGRSFDRAEKELKFIRRYAIQPLFYLDDLYPERLKQCEDNPLMIYFKGKVDLNHIRPIAVVGTRKMSDYGAMACQDIVGELAPYEPLIVSGLAYGVDTCAHRSALEAGLFTVGVLGHGLDRIYPPSNKHLAEKMVDQGGLVTEFLSETKPEGVNFPQRNRIIAGLCDAVVVIEAGVKGGALITAVIANSYNRDVYALPGRVTDDYSKGCHSLIKSNRAALIENGADIVLMAGWDQTKKEKVKQLKLFDELSPDELRIIEVLRKNGDTGIDWMVSLAGMTSGAVAELLLGLEFKKVVKLLPGKVYRLLKS